MTRLAGIQSLADSEPIGRARVAAVGHSWRLTASAPGRAASFGLCVIAEKWYDVLDRPRTV
jgi:hypothetical protein